MADERPDDMTKRITFNVTPEFHTRVKIACALQGKQMGEVLRRILEKEFGTSSNPAGRKQGAA